MRFPLSPTRLGTLAALVLGLAASLAQAQDTGGAVRRVACGAYEAVPSGFTEGRATRLGLLHGGRLVHTITDWAIASIACVDAAGDSSPDLVVETYNGGAHCCTTIRIWTLGQEPKLVLKYDAGDASGYQVRDLDGTGGRELILGDNRLAYFDDLCYACSPSYIPLVACDGPHGFEDCTGRFPAFVRQEQERRLKALREAAADTASGDTRQVQEGQALAALAMSVLLGEEQAGLEAIRAATSDADVLAWVEKARPKVRQWAEGRAAKIATARPKGR